MRAVDIDDALLNASRIQREAAAKLARKMSEQQKGEAFNHA